MDDLSERLEERLLKRMPNRERRLQNHSLFAQELRQCCSRPNSRNKIGSATDCPTICWYHASSFTFLSAVPVLRYSIFRKAGVENSIPVHEHWDRKAYPTRDTPLPDQALVLLLGEFHFPQRKNISRTVFNS